MKEAVQPDLVAAPDERRQQVGIGLGDIARHEESAFDAVTVEQVKQPPAAGARAEDAALHRPENPLGLVVPQIPEMHGLGVDIDREAEAARLAGRPFIAGKR